MKQARLTARIVFCYFFMWAEGHENCHTHVIRFMNELSLLIPPGSGLNTNAKSLRVLGIDLGTTNSTIADIRWESNSPNDVQLRCLEVDQATSAEVARQIGVRDTSVYSWLSGESKPANPERIIAFLDALPVERGSGIAPTGYEYREYKNWRGIPKPRLARSASRRRA